MRVSVCVCVCAPLRRHLQPVRTEVHTLVKYQHVENELIDFCL